MTTDKVAIQLIALRCAENGIRHVVLSPGSRSAPLVIAFSNQKDFTTSVIADERVAGYFALGMAQQLQAPVAVICTSGTAVLNLAPAICEAYYQNLPLLAITADRPAGAHLQGENQAILQQDIFRNYIGISATMDGEEATNENLSHIEKIVENSFSILQNPNALPVHWNVHLQEPLYGKADSPARFKSFPITTVVEPQKEFQDVTELQNQWNSSAKKLVILGMRPNINEHDVALEKLSQRDDVVIWKESTSNFYGASSAVSNVDACLAYIDDEEASKFIPDIIITLGRQIVSKRAKSFLKKYRPVHFDIAPGSNHARNWDMFGSLQKNQLPYQELKVLKLLAESGTVASSFHLLWQQLSKQISARHEAFLSAAPYCDLKVFETLIDSYPAGANIQYGNSSPVRYSNLFDHKNEVTVNANRGTSGIDGCVSTAAGAAYVSQKLTINIVGDVSFIYDSNALWNKQLSEHLRIIVINNGGGNIFRLIEGPASVTHFEDFFETCHTVDASHLASMYGLPYYICSCEAELKQMLPQFYQPQGGKAAIMEIKTDGALSAAIFKNYFSQLKRKGIE
ncbi:MAG: 2-succinyl-5-enolpyruvyl-6-hydroxy-3-cyclohexene-1-carboxylic-acid synthase [Bacteroidetes bacterium]|nr:2-succinyl-5-enolpyruvyl-6-hydroxy-3-cyclohexene-1-carboxylic-acid synthase [Bacteroidota bacterium]